MHGKPQATSNITTLQKGERWHNFVLHTLRLVSATFVVAKFFRLLTLFRKRSCIMVSLKVERKFNNLIQTTIQHKLKHPSLSTTQRFPKNNNLNSNYAINTVPINNACQIYYMLKFWNVPRCTAKKSLWQ